MRTSATMSAVSSYGTAHILSDLCVQWVLTAVLQKFETPMEMRVPIGLVIFFSRAELRNKSAVTHEADGALGIILAGPSLEKAAFIQSNISFSFHDV